jgi:hypothetical protein
MIPFTKRAKDESLHRKSVATYLDLQDQKDHLAKVPNGGICIEE